MRAKRAHFPGLTERERRREKEENQRLPPKIYGVTLVGFHLAKNESSSHRRGVRVDTWKEEFCRRSKRGDFGKSKLSGLGGFLPMYHSPDVRNSSYLVLLSIFGPGKEGFSFKDLFGEEKLDFWVLLDVSLHRRSVCLGEGVNLLRED